MATAAELRAEMRAVEKELERHSRKPFRKELARLLNIPLKAEALEVWANKHPDKWAQALTMLAQLSGYQPGINVNIGAGADPSLMTDVALIEEVRKLSGELAVRAQGATGPVVDAEVIALPAPVASAQRGVEHPFPQGEPYNGDPLTPGEGNRSG